MWKSAYVGVYQLLNWKMHGETLKYIESLFPAGRHKSPSMGDGWWEGRVRIRTSNDGSSTDTRYSLHWCNGSRCAAGYLQPWVL